MGEARRRRERLHAGLRAMHAEGAGAFELEGLRAQDIGAAVFATLTGDPAAIRLLLALVTALRDDRKRGMAFVLCPACAGSGAKANAMTAARRIIPDAREFTVSHGAGHA